MSSASAFNLVMSKTLSFGKGLRTNNSNENDEDIEELSWVNYWDKILLNKSCKNVIKRAYGKLSNVFQDEFIKFHHNS